MIEVLRLRKKFGARVVIDDVTFAAPDGAVTRILGPNGAAKTTVLRMISGMLTPDSGDTWIDGASVRESFATAQPGLGSLLDHTGSYSKLTPRDNHAVRRATERSCRRFATVSEGDS